jgi:hypothetical protein
VPLEAWTLAGGLYIVLVAVARALAPVRFSLGFPNTVPDAAIASDAVLDVASVAEGRVMDMPATVPAHGG